LGQTQPLVPGELNVREPDEGQTAVAISDGLQNSDGQLQEAGPSQPLPIKQALPGLADAPASGGLNLNPIAAYNNVIQMRKAVKAALTSFLNMQLVAQGGSPQSLVCHSILLCAAAA
jgi:hypothetical protein